MPISKRKDPNAGEYPIRKPQRVKRDAVEGTDGARWIGRNRYNFMQAHKRELEDNERVYHINGDKADDTPGNLVAITFSSVHYALKTSKVVWRPRPLHVVQMKPKPVLIRKLERVTPAR